MKVIALLTAPQNRQRISRSKLQLRRFLTAALLPFNNHDGKARCPVMPGADARQPIFSRLWPTLPTYSLCGAA